MVTTGSPGEGLHLRLLDSLRFRSVKVFAAVVESGGIGRASEALGVAQPSVSRSIKDLELLIGGRLFRKVGRRIALTEQGQTLYKHARRLLEDVRIAAEDLEAEELRGHVRVGVLLSAAAQLLPRAIMLSKSAKPEVTISVVEATGDGLLAALSVGQIDMFVGRIFDLDQPAGFRHEVLYEDPILVCARSGHPLFAGDRPALAMADLCEYPWILPPPTAGLRREIESAIVLSAAVRSTRIVESMSVLSNRLLLLHTDMLAFLPQQVVAEDVALGLLAARPLPFEIAAAPIGITFRAERDVSASAAAFVTCLRRAAREMNTHDAPGHH